MLRTEFVDTYREHTRAMQRAEKRHQTARTRERIELCACAFVLGFVVAVNVALFVK